jgi:hypothetical protein
MQKGLKILNDKVILYNTAVLSVLAPKVFRIETGGWVTMSTRKAINTALEHFGFKGIRAHITKGTLYLSYESGETLPVEGSRVFCALK